MNDLIPPKAGFGDILRDAIKGIISAIPTEPPFAVIPAVAAELFGSLVSSNYENSRDKFYQDVANRILALEKKGSIDLVSLIEDTQFTDVLTEATRLAIRTHESEKRKAFKAIIANTAKGLAPNLSATHIFIKLLDRFSDIHIQLLTYFNSPSAYITSRNLILPPQTQFSVAEILTFIAPQPAGNEGILDIVYSDLYTQKLINEPDGHSPENWLAVATTPLAHNFMRFITDSE